MKLVSFEWCAQILFGKAGIHLHMKEQSQLVGSNTKEVNHGSMQGILESVPLSGWKKHMNWLKFGQDSFITQYAFKHLYCSIGTKNKKHKTKQNKKKRLHFYFVIQPGTFDLAISSILKSLWEGSSLCWFKSNNFLNILWFNIFSLKLFQWVIFFSFPISCYLHVHNPNKYITKITIISSSAPSVSQITHKGHENDGNHHRLK